MRWIRTSRLTVRLLIGAFIPRSRRWRTNQRKTEDVRMSQRPGSPAATTAVTENAIWWLYVPSDHMTKAQTQNVRGLVKFYSFLSLNFANEDQRRLTIYTNSFTSTS